MEQNLAFDIALFLIKDKTHVRKIAKALGINHMTISRVLKNLYEQNIVDYKQEGKNKVFFIKKVNEAKNFMIMAELYNLNRFIKKYPALRMIAEEIQKNKEIRIALLFGSYAKDIPKTESDIDIFIETNDKKIKEEVSKIHTKINVKHGTFDQNNLLVKEIIKNHVVLKGAEDYYGKLGFFN